MLIKDGRTSNTATVNDDNHLVVKSISDSIQHWESHQNGQAYQVKSQAVIASGTTTILHIENTSTDKDLVVNYIRFTLTDVVGGTAPPNSANYISLAYDRTRASGGTLAVPTNMNTAAGNSVQATIYGVGPTLAGTADEFDHQPIEAEGKTIRFNKEGSIVIGPNGTMEVSYVGDIAGVGDARVSFLQVGRASN